jgi:hypothetical protein
VITIFKGIGTEDKLDFYVDLGKNMGHGRLAFFRYSSFRKKYFYISCGL